MGTTQLLPANWHRSCCINNKYLKLTLKIKHSMSEALYLHTIILKKKPMRAHSCGNDRVPVNKIGTRILNSWCGGQECIREGGGGGGPKILQITNYSNNTSSTWGVENFHLLQNKMLDVQVNHEHIHKSSSPITTPQWLLCLPFFFLLLPCSNGSVAILISIAVILVLNITVSPLMNIFAGLNRHHP